MEPFTMPTQEKEGARYDMGERNSIADMIEAAAAHIGADVFWHDPKKSSLRYHATLTLDGEEVCVEAVGHKIGARISSDDGSRYWDYNNSLKLANAVKRRMKTAKANEAKWERERDEKRVQEEAEMLARAVAKEELVQLFGEDLVDIATYVDAYYSKEKKAAVAMVSVFINKIRAQRLTLVEAVRFIQAMKSAGYDLVRLNEEKKS